MTQPTIILILALNWNVCQSVCWNCTLSTTTVVIPRCNIQLFICSSQLFFFFWHLEWASVLFKSHRAQVEMAEARLSVIYTFSSLGRLTDAAIMIELFWPLSATDSQPSISTARLPPFQQEEASGFLPPFLQKDPSLGQMGGCECPFPIGSL